jgi:hypothetical protein
MCKELAAASLLCRIERFVSWSDRAAERAQKRILHRPMLTFAAVIFCPIWLSLCAWGQQSSQGEPLSRQIADMNRALVTMTYQPASPAWVSMLLRQRAKLLANMIESDPSTALTLALPAGIAAQLRSIAPDADIESQGEWEGVLEATVADDFERHRSRTQWALQTAHQKFDVYLADLVNPRAGASVKLRGISTAGRIAAAALVTAFDTTVAAAQQQCSTLGPQNIAVLMVTTPANPAFPSAFTPASVQETFFRGTFRRPRYRFCERHVARNVIRANIGGGPRLWPLQLEPKLYVRPIQCPDSGGHQRGGRNRGFQAIHSACHIIPGFQLPRILRDEHLGLRCNFLTQQG